MPGDKLRVVAVLEALTVTGPAKNLLRFCRRVRAGGEGPPIEITIASFARGDGAAGAKDFLAAAEGIPVDLIPEAGRFDWKVIEGLRAVLKKRQADILQTHAVKSGFLTRLGGLHHDYRWLAFHHGYTAEKWFVRGYNQLNRWSLPAAGRVVTVCQPFAGQLAATGVDTRRLEVLPNAIEPYRPPGPDTVEALRARLQLKPGEKVILAIGRLSQEKGQSDLMRAVAKLVQRMPQTPLRLLLVGDGVDRSALEALADRLGIGALCIFAGQQKDVSPYWACADVFVLPSLSEGSPNVLLEAMAAGKPIVSTAVGGVPETVVDEESALLCPAGQPEVLAGKLERILSESGLAERLVAAASARLALFTPEAYERSLRAIYARLLAENR
jgi:glycosyltransferase involved in cell wall biosynthesis